MLANEKEILRYWKEGKFAYSPELWTDGRDLYVKTLRIGLTFPNGNKVVYDYTEESRMYINDEIKTYVEEAKIVADLVYQPVSYWEVNHIERQKTYYFETFRDLLIYFPEVKQHSSKIDTNKPYKLSENIFVTFHNNPDAHDRNLKNSKTKFIKVATNSLLLLFGFFHNLLL